LQVTPRLDEGGVEEVTVEIAAAAAAAGATSIVASQGGRLEPRLSQAGARLIRLPLASKAPPRIAINGLRLARIIRREAVSLIHVRSRAPAFSALIAGRLTGRPVVATYHGVYSARSRLKRWYNSVMTRGVATIVNSAYTKDHVLSQHAASPTRVFLVPEGVDTDRFDPAAVSTERVRAVRKAWGVAADAQVVLLAARLTSWKGHATAIEAFARAAPPSAVLVFAGGGETSVYANDLEARARSAGLGGRLRLAGPTADMPAAYLAADVVLAPSTQPESFGRSAAEACAMGRLTLASRLGALIETIEEGRTGWLIAPADADAWSEALAHALRVAPEARELMGHAARARVLQAFSLEAMTRATFGVYRQVLEAAG
jgi:glycosyltransferase involved in cell wall biosynthesis